MSVCLVLIINLKLCFAVAIKLRLFWYTILFVYGFCLENLVIFLLL